MINTPNWTEKRLSVRLPEITSSPVLARLSWRWLSFIQLEMSVKFVDVSIYGQIMRLECRVECLQHCSDMKPSVVNKLFLSLLFTLERKKTDTRQEWVFLVHVFAHYQMVCKIVFRNKLILIIRAIKDSSYFNMVYTKKKEQHISRGFCRAKMARMQQCFIHLKGTL